MRDLLLFTGGGASAIVLIIMLVGIWFFRNPPLP